MKTSGFLKHDRLQVGDRFRVSNRRLYASGQIKKRGRVNYVVEAEAMGGHVVRYKIRMDELIGGHVERGGHVYEVEA